MTPPTNVGKRLGARLGPGRMRVLAQALIIGVGTKALITLVGMFAVTTAFVHPVVARLQGATWTFTAPGTGFHGLLGKWDAGWYAQIADSGYGVHPNAPAFFPLFPGMESLLSPIFGGAVNAGIAIAFVSSLVAFYLLGRVAEHELGGGASSRAILYLALFPTAIFLMAAYAEALFLALCLASFWAARRGRFAVASIWGLLATTTKPAGIVLLIPLAIMLVQQSGGWRPALRRGAAWLLLLPAGILMFAGVLWAQVGDPWRFLGAQELWNRTLVTPVQGAWSATVAAWNGLQQVFIGTDGNAYGPVIKDEPLIVAANDLYHFAILVALVWVTVVAFRSLPAAYGWFMVGSIALVLSTVATVPPLLSIQRHALVMFPMYIALAAWTKGRPNRHAAIIAVFAVLLGAAIVQWAAWQWVG